MEGPPERHRLDARAGIEVAGATVPVPPKGGRAGAPQANRRRLRAIVLAGVDLGRPAEVRVVKGTRAVSRSGGQTRQVDGVERECRGRIHDVQIGSGHVAASAVATTRCTTSQPESARAGIEPGCGLRHRADRIADVVLSLAEFARRVGGAVEVVIQAIGRPRHDAGVGTVVHAGVGAGRRIDPLMPEHPALAVRIPQLENRPVLAGEAPGAHQPAGR